ncbi:DNA polymerase III subunit gamma and tau, partial [Streptomyces sp. NPDC048629]|uniref:DNA polymerase III subunit gamma and tau n=1 Tax=Streptomyces sp. NPDC048629 TaxID=3154824 RepID=UPI0034263C63
MSSLALYRRYRPESFAEVIGQEHVTDPLQQALRNNRVNHAYLFSGPRGCGKTTSARILARCLNCEQGPTPTPCGECQSCRDLARNGPGSIDVIEIDAASHGGVDDARDLREKAFFGPASSRYKIYIIDEAHMVTSAGFNALLKVVEEPPEHLKFIFATTEPEKVIGTIRSRTHHYPFRLVPPGTLREYLGEVCGREGIPVEDGVLPLVVRAGAGSVRDSMSVMDQLLAGAADDGVTYAMATALLGYTDGSLLDSVVDAFAAGDGAAAFEVVDRVVEGGNDPRRFVADLLERLRDLVILAAVPDAAEKGLIDAPVDVVERMQAQASVFGAAELSRAADLVNSGLTEMRGATSPRLQLELICARVLLPAAFDDERSLQARLDRLERGAAVAPAPVVMPGPPAPAMGYVPGPDAHTPMAPPPPAPAPAPAPAAVPQPVHPAPPAQPAPAAAPPAQAPAGPR